ncbi:bifunctional oligoribonuclease/PAP phosphatase NrnA [Streptococcus sp. X16XC17]|uniref:DHH family phosphoesterase n=1 Tax=unclassified Streptococcus TaxID=2608887 RepID=UPI00066FC2A0|nr:MULTISPECIES: bifunctional oligoribonuclease/PAP phosphatase NrnA [unclassified Streptococcus]TCD46765.1 bifunctional oligoribonuclease/PAP phosphatase NrnA [Streptococcus sp. X16XC17]
MSVFEEMLAKINEFETIIIHRHQRPDPDAIGSQMGLKAILEKNFPEKRILATGFQEPTLAWMAEMDQVLDADYKGTLVIVTDTANTERIDDERYNLGDFLIKIDHHPNDDAYGDLLWVDTRASSASEIITQFAQEMKLTLTDQAAALLYAGIVGDTGRFLYPATTSRTFQVAAYLQTFDVDFASISRRMDEMNSRVAKLMGYVYDHLEIDENGAARVLLTQETLVHYQVTDADTAGIVSSPGRMSDVKTWAIFVEQVDGSYRVRLRSKTVPINEIAKRHGGGGHPLASGANSYSLEENDAIYKEIKEAVAHGSK